MYKHLAAQIGNFYYADIFRSHVDGLSIPPNPDLAQKSMTASLISERCIRIRVHRPPERDNSLLLNLIPSISSLSFCLFLLLSLYNQCAGFVLFYGVVHFSVLVIPNSNLRTPPRRPEE